MWGLRQDAFLAYTCSIFNGLMMMKFSITFTHRLAVE